MIYEDPDELGYSTTGYNPWAGISSLLVCNDMVPPEIRDDIEEAAYAAEAGNDIEAERHRKWAGYGSLGFRDDADGPVKL